MIFMANHGVKNIKPCNKHSLETLVLVDFYILTCLILDPGMGIAAGGLRVFQDAPRAGHLQLQQRDVFGGGGPAAKVRENFYHVFMEKETGIYLHHITRITTLQSCLQGILGAQFRSEHPWSSSKVQAILHTDAYLFGWFRMMLLFLQTNYPMSSQNR